MSRRAWWTLLLLLVALTAASYLPVLRNGLVWDDWPNIARNPNFRGLGAEQIHWAFSSFLLGHYQPLAWLSLGVDHLLWGSNYAGYHLTNVLLHLVNLVLFALIAERLVRARALQGFDPGRAPLAALVAAAVFALHPMRVESVAWITERRHLLAAVFFLAAVLTYVAAIGGRERGRPGARAIAAVTLFFGLSLLSTPLAFALPLVLLLLDVHPVGRWTRGDGSTRLVALALEKWPLFLLSMVFGASALAAQRQAGALLDAGRYDLVQRLAQAAYAALYYPRAMFATVWYPLHERPYLLNALEPRFVVSGLVFLAITAVLVSCRRRFPSATTVWAVYLLLLAPVSGLAQSGIQLVADRYGYLACLGFALLLGAGAARWWYACRGRGERAVWATSVFVVLAFWTSATWSHTGVWRSDPVFWRHVLSGGPSALAGSNLGAMALREGDAAAALRYLRQAVETAPTYGRAWQNLRGLLETDGVTWERRELERTARALEAGLVYQDAAAAWYIAGLARLRLDEPDRAALHFEDAVRIKPDMTEAWLRLALALAVAGRDAEAVETLERAVESNPFDPALRERLETARRSGDL